MKSVTVDFHNEQTVGVFGRHESINDAYTELGEVLDEWKELIAGEGATNVRIRMVYTDREKRVAIEEVDLFQVYKEPRDDADKVTIVQSESIALEVATPDETVKLFTTLCAHGAIAIADNLHDIADTEQRVQQIVLNPSSEEDSVAIDVICKK